MLSPMKGENQKLTTVVSRLASLPCTPHCGGPQCLQACSAEAAEGWGVAEHVQTNEHTASWRVQAEDMHAAQQYLQSIGKTVSGLVGHSKAGSGVVLYAAKYDDIPRVVNISGRFDNQRGALVSVGTCCCAYSGKHAKFALPWLQAHAGSRWRM